MGIIDTIKDVFTSHPEAGAAEVTETPEDSFLGTGQASTGVIPPISTAAGAVLAQPPLPSVEVEREWDPEAPRDNEVVRKD